MKKLLLIGAAFAVLIAPAMAADQAVRVHKRSRPVVVAAPVYSWTGFYAGGHVGGGWSKTTFDDPGFLMEMNNCCTGASSLSNTGAASNANASGFLGGVQAGVMQQVGRLVVGVDLDWSGASLNGSGAAIFPNSGTVFFGPTSATESYAVRINWTATATATLGFAQDRWMYYGKAGAALANESYNLAIAGVCGNTQGPCFGGSFPFGFASAVSDTLVGWTVGIGVKWAVSDAWFVNLEYNYLNFGAKVQNFAGTFTATPWGAPGFNKAANFSPAFYQDISEVKVGLNYKFGQGLGHAADPWPLYQPRLVTKAAPAATYDWTGLYVGAHIGGGWSSAGFVDPAFLMEMNSCCTGSTSLSDTVAGSNANGNGFLGGVQAGGMYQVGRLVVGAEFDWSATSLKGSGAVVYPSASANSTLVTEAYSVQTRWTATATTTVGIAKDRWTLYSKAGIALAHNDYGLAIAGFCALFSGNCSNNPFGYASTVSDTLVGWTLGVGLKLALSGNWFLSAEYDYLAFGSKGQNFAGTFTATPHHPEYNPASTFSPTFNQDISQVKVGLNYMFARGLVPGDQFAAYRRPKYKAAASGYDWTGIYAGGHLGGGWSATTFSDPGLLTEVNNCCIGMPGFSLSDTAATSKATGSGFLSGAQIGAMYQIRTVVVGWDIDWSATRMEESGAVLYPGAVPGSGSQATELYNVRTEWTATATTIFGIARDRWVYYAKAGGAMAHNKYDLTIAGAGCAPLCLALAPFGFASAASDTPVGWTVGAGVKWAVRDNWFLNAEYNFMDFGSKTQNFFGAWTATPWGGPGFNKAASFTPAFYQSISEFKLGFNYKLTQGSLFW